MPNSIKENVNDVSPNHWRVQAVIIKYVSSKLLVLNTYFPTDPRTNNFDTSDLMSTLDVIDETLKISVI